MKPQDDISMVEAFKAKQKLLSSLIGTSANILHTKRQSDARVERSMYRTDRLSTEALNIDNATIKSLAAILNRFSKGDKRTLFAARQWKSEFAENLDKDLQQKQKKPVQHAPERFSGSSGEIESPRTFEHVSTYILFL